MSTTSTTPERMVIAIDPHKASWTAAVVGASLQPVATIRVPVSRDGYRALRRFANRWPDPTWAIEGASGLGAPLTTRLRTDGIDVVDVPAKLAARVRMLSTGHGRKNDDADAVSVAIAARCAPRLNSAAVDGAVIALRAIAEHRDDLVKTRTQTINRLHVVLTHLIPAGASRDLTAERAAELLRGIRPRDTAGRALRGLAADLVAEIRQLDRRIAKAAADIQTAVTESGTTLTDLCGIGALTAGKILGTGSARSIRSVPPPRSPPTPVQLRLMCPPEMSSAIGFRVQVIVNSTSASTSWPSPKSGRTPRAEPITCGSEPTARATKKRCDASNGGCPTSSTDNSATTHTGWKRAREDTRGRLYRPARPAQTPHTDASDKSLPGPTKSHPTTREQRPLDTERRRLDGRSTGSHRRCSAHPTARRGHWNSGNCCDTARADIRRVRMCAASVAPRGINRQRATRSVTR